MKKYMVIREKLGGKGKPKICWFNQEDRTKSTDSLTEATEQAVRLNKTFGESYQYTVVAVVGA